MITFLAGCYEDPSAIVWAEPYEDISSARDTPWHLFGKNGINIGPAWEITKGDKNITIAVIDSEFLPEHLAFSRGKCLNENNYINLLKKEKTDKKVFHGASVTSLISTCLDNPYKIVGVNNRARMQWLEAGESAYAELILWAAGSKDICQTAKWIDCTEPTEYPAQVINLSIAHTEAPEWKSYVLSVISSIRRYAKSIIVAAAGNDGRNAEENFPSSLTGIIAVGSTDINGAASRFSNWGNTVELMAPGENIPVAVEGGIQNISGTSFSAPLVSGVISLMSSVYPKLNWKTALYFLQSTAKKMSCHEYCIANRNSDMEIACKKECCNGEKQTCTPGRIDAGAAIAAAKSAAINGFPSVSLVDAAPYRVRVSGASTEENKQGKFWLFNLGGATGNYKISSPDNSLLFNGDKNTIELEIPTKAESPKMIEVLVTTKANFVSMTKIHIQKVSVSSNELIDQIDIYVID